MARISIIGSGYVGLVYAAAFADLGNDVTGVDINEAKVELLQRGDCPIFEPGLPELLSRNLQAGRLRFTTCYADAVPQSQFVFICVDTPQSFSGEADMRAVRRAATTIAEPLRASGVFPPMVVQMIAVGEQTGALDAMLGKIADFYEEEVDTAVANLTSLLEPLLMVFLGVVVGGVVIAMYLPIFKLVTVVGR